MCGVCGLHEGELSIKVVTFHIRNQNGNSFPRYWMQSVMSKVINLISRKLKIIPSVNEEGNRGVK